MLMEAPVEGMLIRTTELPKPKPDDAPINIEWWSRQYYIPLI